MKRIEGERFNELFCSADTLCLDLGDNFADEDGDPMPAYALNIVGDCHFEKEGKFIILRDYKKEIFARRSGGRGAQHIMQRHLFQNLGEWCLDALEQGCPRWAIPLRKKINSVGQAAWFGWASGREAA
jgi:hypothetical protein